MLHAFVDYDDWLQSDVFNQWSDVYNHARFAQAHTISLHDYWCAWDKIILGIIFSISFKGTVHYDCPRKISMQILK